MIATLRERMQNFIWLLSIHKSPYWCPKMATHVIAGEATTAAAVLAYILEWRSEEPEYCFAEVTCMHTRTDTVITHITTPKLNTTPSKIVNELVTLSLSLSLSLSLYIYIYIMKGLEAQYIIYIYIYIYIFIYVPGSLRILQESVRKGEHRDSHSF